MTEPLGRQPRIRPGPPPSPRTPGRWHKLLVVPPADEVRVVALGESVAWVWRHYLPGQKRFELCLQSIGQPCLRCEARYGREQSGYLAVLWGQEQRTMVITSSAWLYGEGLRRADGALRGHVLRAFRLHPRANGPLRVYLPGDHIDPRRLPAAWDVLSELDVRYGLASRDLGPDQAAGDSEAI